MLSHVRNREQIHGYGYQKVQGFADYIRHHVPEVQWLWIDTCCINQDSDRELTEAINSMFRWYRDAEVCFAYLEDVPTTEDVEQFERSVWFTRGWTLQELLAPGLVVFLSKDWRVVGHKGSRGRSELSINIGAALETRISAICRIPEYILHDYSASETLTIEEKLRWIEHRETTREEDMSYCLLGILGVSMGIRYGDGQQRTKERLLRKAYSQSKILPGIGYADQEKSFAKRDDGHDEVFTPRQRLDLERVPDDIDQIKRPIQHMARLPISQDRGDSLAQLNATIASTSMQLSLLLQHQQKAQLQQLSTASSICTKYEVGSRRAYPPRDNVLRTDVSHKRQNDGKSQRTVRRNATRFREQGWRLVAGWSILSSRMYEVSLMHAASGWDICFRTYNEVSMNSDIVRSCRTGNLVEMRALVAAGKASLLDCCNNGTTLLYVSRLWVYVLDSTNRH
jgi:hypothetical protein